MGDVITVANAEEGGWWEGTLGDRTGWFPSNYVVVVVSENVHSTRFPANDHDRGGTPPDTGAGERGAVLLQQQNHEYREQIVAELIESETAHISDMEEFGDRVVKRLASMQQQQQQTGSSQFL